MWSPVNLPQTDALISPADELFYGGSAGGGKTDLIIGCAVEMHQRSLILRRESTQLRGIVDRSREILENTGARLNSLTGVWRDVPGGGQIELSGCKNETDKRKFQGRPHDLIAFDEATEFLESQVDFIIGWARTEDEAQRVRIIFTGNPPTTAEGQWIIRRFAPWLDDTFPDKAQPGELRWVAMVDGKLRWLKSGAAFEHDGETITPKSRTFIPARVSDNPYYVATNYEAQLQLLPEPLRSQLLYGDFNAATDDDPWQVVPTSWVKAAQERWTDSPPPRLDGLGVDPARGGDDRTAIAERRGQWFNVYSWPGRETPDGPSVAALVTQRWDDDALVTVDIIGIGSSVFDALVYSNSGMRVLDVNFASSTTATDKSGRFDMRNIRAEIWWALREALDPESGDELMLPPSSALRADICAPRWKLTAAGIIVEPKSETKKRLGRSPDLGDALVLALHTVYESTGILL
ncbi:MAG: terminase [Chloroflexi bacterium]|nr:terminase [Chloroflexota bacterium]